MGVTLERVQNKFACIIGELCSEPAVLSKFAIWLDLRLAEYKSKGSISLDCSGENPDPFWLNGHEKEETRETPVGGDLGDYHYSPRAVPRHPSHSPIHRFPPPGGTRTILPESASKDSMTSGPAVFKKESESDDQNDVFPVSLHRIESSQERKRPAAEPISKSHESYSDLHPSKVSRIADDMSSALVEQAMGTNTGFTPSYLHGSDDDFDSSNDDTDTEFNSALAQSQAGASSLPKGDNSLTFSSQNSLSADDSSLQHRLSFQSNTGDLSNLSQDLGSNSDHQMERAGIPISASSSETMQSCRDTSFSQSLSTSGMAVPFSADRTLYRQAAKLRIVDIEAKSFNTVRHLAGAVATLEHWLHANYGEQRPIETIPPGELNKYLTNFFAVIKRQSGQDYDIIALSSLKSYLERFLKELNYPESISQSFVFGDARRSYGIRRKELKLKLSQKKTHIKLA